MNWSIDELINWLTDQRCTDHLMNRSLDELITRWNDQYINWTIDELINRLTDK